jgi:hypothetical protein
MTLDYIGESLFKEWLHLLNDSSSHSLASWETRNGR